MGKPLLPRFFFEDNPLEEISTAYVGYLTLSEDYADVVQAALAEQLGTDAAVRERVDKEKEEIARLDSGEAVVRFMRRGCHIGSRDALLEKARSMEEEVYPALLRRYRTSSQDVFLETAAYVLAKGGQAGMEQLKAVYPEIRDSYARSVACLLFGLRRQEDTIPLLLSEYRALAREDETGDLAQGPLLALYILYDML